MSNPYELRFSLLQMAQGYLSDQQVRQQSVATDAWEFIKGEERKGKGEATMEIFKDLQPDPYTIDDIKKKATELYEFVEKQ